MARTLVPGLRRSLLIYCAAVVLPTLAVLTLGALAARRQYEAVETLRTTTRRLQEGRLAEQIERRTMEAAAAAMENGAFGTIVEDLSSNSLGDVDRARAEIRSLRTHFPIVREVFVAGEGSIVYPRVHPPLPRPLSDWTDDEPAATRERLATLLSEAERLESAGRYRAAEAAYRGARRLAATRRMQALATVGIARALTGAGEPAGAADAWESIVRDFDDQYNRHDRPHAVVAAAALEEIAPERSQPIARVRSALVGGRWSLTPDQTDYFLGRLPRPAIDSGGSTFLDTLAFARRLAAAFPLAHPSDGGRIRPATIAAAGVRDRLFFRHLPGRASGQLAGIAVDDAWLEQTLVPEIAAALVPGLEVRIDNDAGQTSPYRPGPAALRVLVSGGVPAAWKARDLLVFSAGVTIVLGVLVLGVVLLARDVARETRINQMRADLVSGVSHELKSPLSVIRVCAETIDDLPDADAVERRHFAAAIVQETDRLGRLIEDVVDFSRIQQGQRPYRMAPASLIDAVGRAAERFARYGRLHGFTLHSEIPAASPATLLDERAVEQAVMNLLENAAKYSGDSTTIELRVREAPGELLVEVRDYGVGIPLEEQTRIFDRFHRGRHADRGGYGLGLYLVRHIMDAHGGCVEVSSAPGEGSRFTLRFPVGARG